MAYIELDRRFVEWRQPTEGEEPSDPDFVVQYGRSDSILGWDALLKRRRAVVLAEGGSGKSLELENQAERLAASGRWAFYAKVQDVGRDGLEAAIRVDARDGFKAWQRSAEPAWFFIDSVDEAKLNNIQLDRALRQIAEAIRGHEQHAHIVLSGRHTDWEFRRDLARLKANLPLPEEFESAPVPTADELMLRALHERHRKEKPESIEEPLIVLIAPLDEDRVRKYAVAKGTTNVDALVAQIESANLWRFTRRPLDLGWLVEFWNAKRRLGTLAEMLAESLRQRAREKDPDRSRRDGLGEGRAMRALERIGAALVLGRKSTITIPDGDESHSPDPSALDLEQVLPDWSGVDRTALRNLPAFDPATFGRARLHNDNEGVVRAYLAAQWLIRLRRENLSRQGLFRLVFGNSYGVATVKPSMREVAGWLTLWDSEVANEVIRREPYLLLTTGDPASLTPELRARALSTLIERIAGSDEHLPSLDPDSVRRFAKPDLAAVIRTLWSKHRSHDETRRLLLRLIWFGQIRDCLDIAQEALRYFKADSHDQVMAGRALLVTADPGVVREYAVSILKDIESVDQNVLWDAVDNLFPAYIDVPGLLRAIAVSPMSDAAVTTSFRWQGPALVRRIKSPADMEAMVAGLMAQIGPPEGTESGVGDDSYNDPLASALDVANCRLLAMSPPDNVSDLSIDAAARVGRRRLLGRGGYYDREHDAGAELRRSGPRRRRTLWRLVETASSKGAPSNPDIEHPYQIDHLGWSLGLDADDIAWLLDDVRGRPTPQQRALAIRYTLLIWQKEGRDACLKERIWQVVASEPTLLAICENWIQPPIASDPSQTRQRYEARQAKDAAERAASDDRWRELIAKLQADPDQIRQLPPATATHIDARLYHLWFLLNSATYDNSHHSIASVAPLEAIVGARLAGAFCEALSRHWRTWEPTLQSSRNPPTAYTLFYGDIMGIAGLSLEAGRNPSWTHTLDSALASRAARYATLELNGLPAWIADLSKTWPTEVANVLIHEIQFELSTPEAGARVVRAIPSADPATIEPLIPRLVDEFERRPTLSADKLDPLFDVLGMALDPSHRARIVALATAHCQEARDMGIAAMCLAAALSVGSESAVDALFMKLDGLSINDQRLLVQNLLPLLYGNRFARAHAPPALSTRNLARLVRLAYATIRVEDDNSRPHLVSYSPDARDDAEEARGRLFKTLVEQPGLATYNALIELSSEQGFPIRPSRLRSLAHDRAAVDAELAPWLAGEAHAFEAKCEALPLTTLDLQRLMLDRIGDLQDALLNDEYAQGETVSHLPNEKEVQKWMANHFRQTRGRSYTLEREPHVVEEKEPDIRVQSTNGVAVPIEVKVAETWSLADLETALNVQLCGQYLRSKHARHGILLLVHQKPRPTGWQAADGHWMGFQEVVQHLRTIAAKIAGQDSDTPQPEVIAIDVSSVWKLRTKARKKKVPKGRSKTVGRTKAKPKKRSQPSKKARNPAR